MKHQTKIAIISVVLVMPIANVQSTEIQQKFNSSTSNQLNQADKHLTSRGTRGTRTVQTPQENRNRSSHQYNPTSKKNNVRRGTRANHYEMLSAKPVVKRDKIIRRGNRASKS